MNLPSQEDAARWVVASVLPDAHLPVIEDYRKAAQFEVVDELPGESRGPVALHASWLRLVERAQRLDVRQYWFDIHATDPNKVVWERIE